MRSSGDCVPVGDGVPRATSAPSASRHSHLAGRVSWDGSIPGGVAGARAGRRAGLAAGRRVGRGSRTAGRGGGETVMRSMIGTAAALASMAVLTPAIGPPPRHLNIPPTALVLPAAGVFGSAQVALVLPQHGRWEVAACAGEPLTEQELHRVLPAPGELASRGAQSLESGGLLVLALAAAGRPVGLLVLSGETAARHEREPLLLFPTPTPLAAAPPPLRD